MAKQSFRPGWVPVEDERLTAMFNNGSSDQDISRTLARSVMAVKRRRQILGLQRGPAPADRTTVVETRV